MLHEVLQALAGRRGPQLLKGDWEDYNLIEESRPGEGGCVCCMSANAPCSSPARSNVDAYTDNFLIRSRKESSSLISGMPWKKETCGPAGDGDRGGSFAPGRGRDLTRSGMAGLMRKLHLQRRSVSSEEPIFWEY